MTNCFSINFQVFTDNNQHNFIKIHFKLITVWKKTKKQKAIVTDQWLSLHRNPKISVFLWHISQAISASVLVVIYYNLHCQEQCKNILPFTCRILCQPFDVLKIEGCDISELEYKNKSPNINIKLSYSCMYISMFFVTLNNCFKFIFHFLLETVKFCHHIVNPIFPVKFKASVTYSFMIFIIIIIKNTFI